jgi:2,4-dienoyl-CoA reductase-like NADH-dependent reductase (Old Yellow Enzyme family)
MSAHAEPRAETADPLFTPLEFRSGLTVKNRLFRSNVSGRFDYYNGAGSEARINWETSFARGGVGGILSSFTPVSRRGRILFNYAMIDDDDKIPFWHKLGLAVHDAGRRVHAVGKPAKGTSHEAVAYDAAHPQNSGCAYIMQLSHSGRQQDGAGVENPPDEPAISSTGRADYFHGILCRAMTKKDIRQVVQQFADGAWRAKEAGLDGVELHGANGYLITQFLSSGINDRTDEYGGSLKNRARFVLEIIDAIRQRVGGSFHLQLKTNAVDFDNALYPWRRKGNTLEDALQVCAWAEQAGVDALHISSGSIFPHPRNPPGDFPVAEALRWYGAMLDSGVRTRFNYWIFKSRLRAWLFRWWWNFRRAWAFEDIKLGINLAMAAKIKEEARVHVIVTGGFQHRQVIVDALRSGQVDAVSIARPLIANRDLPKLFFAGMDWSDANWVSDEQWPIQSRLPCTYCNKCLINDVVNPLGCYDLTRFRTYEEMIEQVMSVFPRPT